MDMAVADEPKIASPLPLMDPEESIPTDRPPLERDICVDLSLDLPGRRTDDRSVEEPSNPQSMTEQDRSKGKVRF